MKVILILFGAVLAAYDYSPIVPMAQYLQNYRTLNVWECFEALGKFCVRKNGISMIQITGSSNRAHGICCKPDFFGQYCEDNGDIECSPPARDDLGHPNSQMF